MGSLGTIGLGTSIDTSGFKKGFASATADINKFKTESSGIFSGISGGLAKFGLAVGGIKAAIGVLSTPFKAAAQIEELSISFEVMLGSASKAKVVLDDIKKMAASTPFEFPELAKNAKMLLGYGFTAEELQMQLLKAGSASKALSIDIDEMTKIIGKVKATGKVNGEILTQSLEKGLPITKALASVMQVTEKEVFDLASTGQIGFKHFDQAMSDLIGKGGAYNGILQKQSQSLSGLASTASDEFGTAMATLGQRMVDTFNVKDLLSSAIDNMGAFTKWLVGEWDITVEKAKSIWTAYGGTFLKIVEMMRQGWYFVTDVFVYAWQNAGSYFELGIKGMAYGIVWLYEEAKHTFTKRIPIAVQWFADNFFDVLKTVWDYGRTVFTNLAGNIWKIMKNLPSLIAGTTDWSTVWTPLEQGFTSSLKSLPEIPERIIGQIESNLKKDMQGLNNQLATGFDEFRKTRQYARMEASKEAGGVGFFGQLQLDATKALEQAKALPKTGIKIAADAATKKGGEKTLASAAELGSKEAFKTIFDFKFGGTTDPQKQVAKNTSETNKLLSGLPAAIAGAMGSNLKPANI